MVWTIAALLGCGGGESSRDGQPPSASAPVITSDGGGANASRAVAENGTAVTTVTATDADVGAMLTYAIDGGPDASRFAIGSSTGVLTFAAAPDFEAPSDANGDNVYEVDVRVSDGALDDRQSIAVTVTGVNEAPVITSDGGGASASRDVTENVTVVTTVTATDPDGATTFAYSIDAGPDAAVFEIDAAGVLAFVAPPDFEAPADSDGDNVYEIDVRVTAGALSDSQAIAVTVTGTNEAPVITSDGGGASATLQLQENGTAVTTVVASDADAATTLTYTIAGGPDAGRFAIDAAGALTFVAPPDFEAPADSDGDNVYDVTVRVSDGALSDTQAIAVTVTDLNENPIVTKLNFSTYLGQNAHDFVRDVAVDASGNVYAVGGAESSDLPTTAGTEQPIFGGFEDAFVAKFAPSGSLIWATFLGGIELDRAYAVEVSGSDVIIAGRAGEHFPVTPGVIQAQFQGSSTVPGIYPQPQDGFVAKLRASNGTLVWATFFGAASDGHENIVRDIAVDGATGSIYLAASTEAGGAYPAAIQAALANGHQSSQRGGQDGVLAKLSSDGQSMPWATYVGGSGDELSEPSVRVDSQGRPIVVFSSTSADAPTTAGVNDASLSGGRDWYVAKYEVTGALAWATYVGGNGGEGTETHNLAIRADDSLVIAGGSSSTDFTATVSGAYDGSQNGNGGSGTGAGTNYGTDCAIAVLPANGGPLLAATYFGGAVGEACEGVGVDVNRNIYVTGGSFSADLPTTSGAHQSTKPGTISPFIAVFNRDLTALRYASYYGGTGNSVGRCLAVHGEGHFTFGGEAGVGWPLQNAVRSTVSAADTHGGLADVTVPLGPG
jgi:VCBS repeat-containing protein